MLFNSNFFRATVVLSLILLLIATAFGDTVRLKDGRIIKGKITNFGSGKFTVLFEDGARSRQMNFSADEVDSIVFDSDAAPASVIKTSNPVSTTSGDKTIITVGQTNNSQTSLPKTSAPENTNRNASTVAPKPITLDLKVLADNTSNGWTNSGWVVRKGQKIRISGTGRVSLGNGRFSTPTGISSLPDNEKLLKTQPTGGLIAVIGDDNNDFIFIGDSYEFIAARDGALFLGVNEGNLDDNSGAFDVKVEISPEIGN